VAAEFIWSELVNKVYDQYLYELASNEIWLSKEEFLRSLNLATVDTKTAFQWLRNLGSALIFKKKVYFNDCHENPENIADQKVFINRYFQYELYAHHWVQLPTDDAKHYEEELDDNGNKWMAGACTIEWKDKNGILMREYHVNCHPDFFSKYVTSKDNKKFGGSLSMCKLADCHPKLFIGQDELIIKENLFSSKQWTGSEDQNAICPKDDGHAWMIGAFISQAWSFDIAKLLTVEKLGEINEHRRGQHYLSVDSTMKSMITQPNKISRMHHCFAGILNMGQTRKATGTSIMPPFSWKMWLIV